MDRTRPRSRRRAGGASDRPPRRTRPNDPTAPVSLVAECRCGRARQGLADMRVRSPDIDEGILTHLGFARPSLPARSTHGAAVRTARTSSQPASSVLSTRGESCGASARRGYCGRLRHVPDVVLRCATLGRDLAARQAGNLFRWYLPSADFDQVADSDNCPVTLEHAKSVAVTVNGVLASPHNEDRVVAEPA